MEFIAEREKVTAKKIAATLLQLTANRDYDRKTSEFCEKIVETREFRETNHKLQFELDVSKFEMLCKSTTSILWIISTGSVSLLLYTNFWQTLLNLLTSTTMDMG